MYIYIYIYIYINDILFFVDEAFLSNYATCPLKKTCGILKIQISKKIMAWYNIFSSWPERAYAH